MPALFLNLSPMEIKRPFDSTKKNPSVRGFGDFQHIESMGKVHLSQTPVKAYFKLTMDEKEPRIKNGASHNTKHHQGISTPVTHNPFLPLTPTYLQDLQVEMPNNA